jgi:DnaK suppressor protein
MVVAPHAGTGRAAGAPHTQEPENLMNDKERKHLEERLLQERERQNRALERLDEDSRIGTEDDGALTQYSQHPADEGTDTIEQETALLLHSQSSVRLAQIDEALRRLYKEPEAYGRCDVCGAAIELERLDVVPWARFCLEHQAEVEGG